MSISRSFTLSAWCKMCQMKPCSSRTCLLCSMFPVASVAPVSRTMELCSCLLSAGAFIPHLQWPWSITSFSWQSVSKAKANYISRWNDEYSSQCTGQSVGGTAGVDNVRLDHLMSDSCVSQENMQIPLLTACGPWGYAEQSADLCERDVASAGNGLTLAVSCCLWKGRHYLLDHELWDMSLTLSTILCQEVTYSSMRVCFLANCCTAGAGCVQTHKLSQGHQPKAIYHLQGMTRALIVFHGPELDWLHGC